MTPSSRPVISSQSGVHQNLAKTVRKHLSTKYEKPIAEHSTLAFEKLTQKVTASGAPLILDAGCGTGDSTRALAKACPQHLVIGIDKSARRLGRTRDAQNPDNMILLQGDMMDLYRLMAKARWRLARHYLLFPSPWPKPGQLSRRWHGSPVFPSLLALGGRLELRTNWRPYADEFVAALEICGMSASLETYQPMSGALSLFEQKYRQSGHVLYRAWAELGRGGSLSV